jgi:hypothetical protein
MAPSAAIFARQSKSQGWRVDSGFVQSLASKVAPTLAPSQDRRRSAREMRRLDAWLSDSSGDGVLRQQQQVTVTSLSMHGVGFTASKALEPGASHWLVIANDRLHLSTRLRVISVRERADGGGCDVGAEFF